MKYKTRFSGGGCGQTFVEQYSYKNYGAMVTKRLKMVRGSASGVLLKTADYDTEGRPTNTTYPVSGRTVAYEYDANRGLPSAEGRVGWH
ncbi:hypothetical protein F183_A03590 [Bryobacterales bacterium F-183]|nr:hypothetical protein F183_A03590 [Bryobacterales bacterium F-183]